MSVEKWMQIGFWTWQDIHDTSVFCVLCAAQSSYVTEGSGRVVHKQRTHTLISHIIYLHYQVFAKIFLITFKIFNFFTNGFFKKYLQKFLIYPNTSSCYSLNNIKSECGRHTAIINCKFDTNETQSIN